MSGQEFDLVAAVRAELGRRGGALERGDHAELAGILQEAIGPAAVINRGIVRQCTVTQQLVIVERDNIGHALIVLAGKRIAGAGSTLRVNRSTVTGVTNLLEILLRTHPRAASVAAAWEAKQKAGLDAHMAAFNGTRGA